MKIEIEVNERIMTSMILDQRILVIAKEYKIAQLQKNKNINELRIKTAELLGMGKQLEEAKQSITQFGKDYAEAEQELTDAICVLEQYEIIGKDLFNLTVEDNEAIKRAKDELREKKKSSGVVE